MTTTHWTFLVIGALASSAGAQSTCQATMRQLAALSPRQQVSELSLRGRPDYQVLADGAACSALPRQKDDLVRTLRGVPVHVRLQPVELRGSVLGGVPDSRQDGAAWSGRGANLFLSGGIAADAGRVHVVFAPDLWYSQNQAFQIFPSPDGSRSPFSSPWYVPPFPSIDLPLRFGAAPIKQFDLGETALWASVHVFDVGLSTSSQRWGPGERGSMTLGADAPGIPRIFVRTAEPDKTRIGVFSGTAFIGTLSESRFFDFDQSNDIRSMIAFNVAWSRTDTSAFTIGLAHAAMRLGSQFTWSDSPNSVRGPADEINEVYLQLRDPHSGIRAWAEIGRAGPLPHGSEFFAIPYQGISYIVGFDRAAATSRGTIVITGEATNVEQPTDLRGVPTLDFYTSHDVPQGWTQRGQLLADATGPGSQSQWLSADWIAPRWSFGLFAERVRWNEDAFLRIYLPYPNRHDVTLRGGLRASGVAFGRELAVELSTGHRLNYLFQDNTFVPGYRTVDVAVPELRFSLSPAGHAPQ